MGSSTSIDKSTNKSTFRNMSQPNSLPSSLLPPPTSNSKLQTCRSPKWQVDRLKVENLTRLALVTHNLCPTCTRILESYLHIHMTKNKPTLHNDHSFWLIVSISSAQLSLHHSCTNHTLLDPPAAAATSCLFKFLICRLHVIIILQTRQSSLKIMSEAINISAQQV